jgi:hypothetical protein
MADLIKPDEIIAKLQNQLAKAKTKSEKEAIQEKINQRQQEVFAASGFSNVGFGGKGYYVPGSGQGVGTEVLEPTAIPGVYSKSVITSDTTKDSYGRKNVSVDGNKRTFYDANGNPISPESIAKSAVGQQFAAAGWDIGFGPGVIPEGTPIVSVDTADTGASTSTNLSTSTTDSSEQDSKRAAGQSAYNLLFEQFSQYGLGSLIEPLKGFIVEGLSPAEFTLRLRETDAYKKRFAANAQRIKAGLRALSEAEYITLEDQYQNVMRNYGLPASYYTRGDMGVQTGFEKFIAGDVSAAELEDRIQTAQNRVINAAPQVSQALRQFYPDITNGDILAYALDPDQALTNIKRKVGAAEIGAGAMQAGLATGLSRAEELQRFGVTGEQARQGYQAIAEFLPSATKLGDIYRKSGMGPYNQAVAEQEVFGITGAADAASKRKKLAQLETAQFSGQVGAAGSALGRERAGQF